jgi:hypothetical protein
MTPFDIVHEFTCSPERFWEVFFDDAFNAALNPRVGLRERRFLELEDTPTHKHWKVLALPERELPGFVKAFVSGELGYVETASFDKVANRIDCKVEPTLMKEKIEIASTYTLETIAPGRLKRSYVGSVNVKVPLVGRKAEEFIIRDMSASYDKTAVFTNEWLAQNP